MSFDIKNVIYKPLKIFNETVDAIKKTTGIEAAEADLAETNKVADRLLDHLKLIDQYNKQIEAIDYLIDNAARLAENNKYTTEDESIVKSIAALGGSTNSVDFILFKKAVDIMLQTYEDMAILALTGKNK
jgi:hypothetical protein